MATVPINVTDKKVINEMIIKYHLWVHCRWPWVPTQNSPSASALVWVGVVGFGHMTTHYKKIRGYSEEKIMHFLWVFRGDLESTSWPRAALLQAPSCPDKL